jgi:Tfp pilus assembly protein PilP
MPLSRILPVVMSCLVAVGAWAGCEGDTGGFEPPPPPPPRAAAVAAQAVAPPTPATSLINEIDRNPFATSARDPFTPPQRDEAEVQGAAEIAPDCDLELDPLGETNINQLTLLGILTGTAVPRAMFLVPGTRQALFVTEGARVGPRCSFRVVDIRDNEVVFEQLTSIESERQQSILTLHQERVAAEIINDR